MPLEVIGTVFLCSRRASGCAGPRDPWRLGAGKGQSNGVGPWAAQLVQGACAMSGVPWGQRGQRGATEKGGALCSALGHWAGLDGVSKGAPVGTYTAEVRTWFWLCPLGHPACPQNGILAAHPHDPRAKPACAGLVAPAACVTRMQTLPPPLQEYQAADDVGCRLVQHQWHAGHHRCLRRGSNHPAAQRRTAGAHNGQQHAVRPGWVDGG